MILFPGQVLIEAFADEVIGSDGDDDISTGVRMILTLVMVEMIIVIVMEDPISYWDDFQGDGDGGDEHR